MFYDANGLIVQENGDGGDTAGREGDYWFSQALYSHDAQALTMDQQHEFDRVLTLLQVSPGIFIRNPVQYNNPKDFSRDQTVPLILAMGQMKRPNVLWKLFKLQIKNLFRYQNNDIGFFQDLNYYIRAFNWLWLYPLLFIGDLFILGESIVRCIQGRDPNNVGDDINHTLVLIQAQYNMATPISLLARFIYKKFRPQGIQYAWDWYFRPSTGANDFSDIYKKLIEAM
jgi:hypothetical protein